MTIIDMHLHVSPRSPCSVMPVEDLMNNLSQRLDAICITDHWVLEPIEYLKFQDFPIYFGAEITCDLGDILAYGIEQLPPHNLSAQDALDFIHKQGGMAVCPHAYSDWHYAFGDEVLNYDFDAIELNGQMNKSINEMAKRAAKIMDLPTIGGSDSHSVPQLNTIATRFEDEIFSIDDIVKAIKEKKCKAIYL